MSQPYRSYTPAEKRRRFGLVLRGSKQAIADAPTGRYDAQIKRIDVAAEERGAREVQAAAIDLQAAQHRVASLKVALKSADREARPAARAALRDAEQAERRAQQTACGYGL